MAVRLLDTDEGRQLITSLRDTGAFTANLTMLNLGKEGVLRYLLHHHPETIMPKDHFKEVYDQVRIALVDPLIVQEERKKALDKLKKMFNMGNQYHHIHLYELGFIDITEIVWAPHNKKVSQASYFKKRIEYLRAHERELCPGLQQYEDATTAVLPTTPLASPVVTPAVVRRSRRQGGSEESKESNILQETKDGDDAEEDLSAILSPSPYQDRSLDSLTGYVGALGLEESTPMRRRSQRLEQQPSINYATESLLSWLVKFPLAGEILMTK
jgi:hypothetical protein